MTDDIIEVSTCRNCEHARKHNLWGKCSEDGCDCRSYDPDDEAKVLVLRNPETFRPVAIPEDTVREADRVFDAYTRHRDGEPWKVIAATSDPPWPSAAAVATEVRRYLDEGRAIFRGMKGRELMALEIDRLNALQTYFLPAAKAGKVPAGQLVLSCIKARIDAYAKTPEDPAEIEGQGGAPRMLVIDAEDYTGHLGKVSEQ